MKSSVSRSWLTILTIFLVVLLFSLFLYQLAQVKGIPPKELTTDPASVSGLPSYIGSVTFVFVIMWSVTASISTMGAILLPKNIRRFWFLLSAGIFTSLLTLDDAFQIHQISENVIFSIYFLFVLIFLLYFHKEILGTTCFPLLGISLLWMAASMVTDVFTDHVFIADILKLFGAAYWLAYFSRTALHFIKEQMRLL
jgi:hypothetical protein